MKRLTVLLCVIVMMGCSSSLKLAKPGMTQKEWHQDYYECSVQADEAIGYNVAYRTALGNAIASGTDHRRHFDTCLEAKGYLKISAQEYDRTAAKQEE
jgi:hypothetical protein